MPIGRVSFDDEKLVENFKTVYDLMVKSKPSTAKGVYMKNIVISSSMGPAVKVVTSM
jgi:large subunit ribosomal protein L1